MKMPLHRLVIRPRSADHPYAVGLLADAKALGFNDITQIDYQDLYFIAGNLSTPQLALLSSALLCDPVTQVCDWQPIITPKSAQSIEVLLRPGVTDPTAAEIIRGAQLLGINNIENATAGKRYEIHSANPLQAETLHQLAKRLLANTVIHDYTLGTITADFPLHTTKPAAVDILPLRTLDDEQLLALSQHRRAALDLAEMRAVQIYFQNIARDPTDVEFEMIAQTWSEHCCHKTFKALITTTDGQTINGLLRTYIRAATEKINAPWVASAFVDNAGIINFDGEYQISFKVETHNHPSAIEPFGGANTGMGGVIRDILGVSAKPIAATDIFCFGPANYAANLLPDNVLHPRRIRSGVIAGVEDYGNKTGIPTVNGAIYYDSGYLANPLVFCGCVGIAPQNSHRCKAQAGDRVIVLGGRTGRDGLRGATFSSMTMDAQTEKIASASVQIGDPIIAKGLIEVIARARDLGLYTAITDCGAGGLSSAIGEMASNGGAEVDLALAPLKYPGLAAWEIWLSEAQERMLLAIPPANLPALQKICDTYAIELSDLGYFTDTQHLVVRHGTRKVLDLQNEFLFNGAPQKQFTAQLPVVNTVIEQKINTVSKDYAALLLKLLAHPNIASKEAVIRRYDHEVQGATVIKPLVGIQNDGPSDACVLKPLMTKGQSGIVLANGINPEFGKHDPYRMALSVIDEAIRNAIAVGANPDKIALLDNFCWGDPNRPETLGSLVAAAQGCYDGALHYRAPFISGKDSLNNEYVNREGARLAIPATLLISVIAIIDDIARAVSMDFKSAGNLVYLLGETRNEFAGSHYALCGGQLPTSVWEVPNLPAAAPALYRALHQAMQQGLVRACHDLSEGGLAVAAAEMCMAGRLGCRVELAQDDLTTALFSESNGRLLVEVEAKNATAFNACFTDNLAAQVNKIGSVTDQPELLVSNKNQIIFSAPISKLLTAWRQTL